jgi:hypothetical protein
MNFFSKKHVDDDGISSYCTTYIICNCTWSSGDRDCDLCGDHLARSDSENGNCFHYSWCGSIGNSSCEANCLLGFQTYFSCLACNFALGAIFGDLGFSTSSWGYFCFGIIKVVNSRVWCKVLLICHFLWKAKGVSSSSSNSNIVFHLVICLCLSNSRFIHGNWRMVIYYTTLKDICSFGTYLSILKL